MALLRHWSSAALVDLHDISMTSAWNISTFLWLLTRNTSVDGQDRHGRRAARWRYRSCRLLRRRWSCMTSASQISKASRCCWDCAHEHFFIWTQDRRHMGAARWRYCYFKLSSAGEAAISTASEPNQSPGHQASQRLGIKDSYKAVFCRHLVLAPAGCHETSR